MDISADLDTVLIVAIIVFCKLNPEIKSQEYVSFR